MPIVRKSNSECVREFATYFTIHSEQARPEPIRVNQPHLFPSEKLAPARSSVLSDLRFFFIKTLRRPRFWAEYNSLPKSRKRLRPGQP